MSVYTYRQLQQMEREYKSTRHYFYDVVFQMKGGNPANDIFRESDSYSEYTYTNEEQAKSCADRLSNKYANDERVSIHIKVWSCLNDEFKDEEIIIVKVSKYFEISK